MPRYLLLMTEADHFAKWDAADDELRARVYADFGAFAEAARARGTIVGGEALAPSSTARTVRGATGGAERPPVTDGPYAETVEQLGGFYLIEADDLATATELAALLPREYDVEVRECVDVPDH
ncbi:YciI family protein [Nocardioides litoris]|uniref:YciI family protein n=1 Tax=Nocardioides litoris TaxID=1926648 RepID=UPI00111D4AD6|nr:YciI family protein [Nocardioides litoris]